MRISDWSSDVCSSDLAAFMVVIAQHRDGRDGAASQVFGQDFGLPRLAEIGEVAAQGQYVCPGGNLLEHGAVAMLGRIRDVQVADGGQDQAVPRPRRSEEHTSELQSLLRISYADC